MTVVIDASVALKWVLEEPLSEAAVALVATETLAAPDLLFVECANILWSYVKAGDMAPVAANQALAAIESTPIRVTPIKTHIAAALAIAVELQQNVYDCLYLATAIAERAKLVTADEAFVAAAKRHPVLGASIQRLR
jgi:predicted nucleic acid-binding protein